MIYFTSDLHLGHASAIEFMGRPFSSVEEMNQILIQNINDTVSAKDELWIIGDFSYKLSKDEVKAMRKAIRWKHVHLIYGNHDKDYSQDGIFQSVQHYKELKTDYGRVVLFHYPILEWSAAHYGSIHLHGHIHSTGEYNAENLTKKFADRISYGHSVKVEDLGLRIYDVGVDTNDYRPISLQHIAELMHVSPIKTSIDNTLDQKV